MKRNHCIPSLVCYTVTNSSTPQKIPRYAQSTSFWTKANNSGSAKTTVSSAIYTTPRARMRRPSSTSSQRSRLRPFSIGTISCPALITPWRWSFPTNTGLTTLTHTSNEPSHTRPTFHTWVVRCICRPGFGITNAISKRQSRRVCALLVFTRGLDLRRMRRTAGLSSAISKRK